MPKRSSVSATAASRSSGFTSRYDNGIARFSATVRSSIKWYCWNTNPTYCLPSAMRSLCFSLCTAFSSRRYSPVQSPSSIPSTASNVDFPAPDGPMIVTKSPDATSREIRRNTNSRPSGWGKDFSSSRTERKGLGPWAWGLGIGASEPAESERTPVTKPQARGPSPQSLFISQRDHRIDACRAARGSERREKRERQHRHRDDRVHAPIGRRDAEQDRPQRP